MVKLIEGKNMRGWYVCLLVYGSRVKAGGGRYHTLRAAGCWLFCSDCLFVRLMVSVMGRQVMVYTDAEGE